MDIKEMRPIAEKMFADIRELTFDGVGVSRESYGAKESATADYLRALGENAAGFALDVAPRAGDEELVVEVALEHLAFAQLGARGGDADFLGQAEDIGTCSA